MTSSVASGLRWKARRIWCCLASSRENTVTERGSPISPPSNRRTSTFPSEPVPPVTTTLLSLRTIEYLSFETEQTYLAHFLSKPGPFGTDSWWWRPRGFEEYRSCRARLDPVLVSKLMQPP